MEERMPNLTPESAGVLKISNVYHVRPGAGAGMKMLRPESFFKITLLLSGHETAGSI